MRRARPPGRVGLRFARGIVMHVSPRFACFGAAIVGKRCRTTHRRLAESRVGWILQFFPRSAPSSSYKYRHPGPLATPSPSVSGMATERVTRSLSRLGIGLLVGGAAVVVGAIALTTQRRGAGRLGFRAALAFGLPGAAAFALAFGSRRGRARGAQRDFRPAAPPRGPLGRNPAQVLARRRGGPGSVGVRVWLDPTSPGGAVHHLLSRGRARRLDRRLRSRRSGDDPLGGDRRRALRATRRPAGTTGGSWSSDLPARVPRHRGDRLGTARRAGARATARERNEARPSRRATPTTRCGRSRSSRPPRCS